MQVKFNSNFNLIHDYIDDHDVRISMLTKIERYSFLSKDWGETKSKYNGGVRIIFRRN